MLDLEVADVIVVVVYWIIRREFIYLFTDYLFIYVLFNQWSYINVFHWVLDDFERKWLWPSLR